jgi:putative flippase GtrA
MSANSSGDSVLSDLQLREGASGSRQLIDLPELVSFASQGKARKSDADVHSKPVNSRSEKEIQARATQMAAALSRKDIPCNDMQGIQESRDGEKAKKKSENFYAASTFVRWCKFNFVGGIGIVVQFAALILLKSALHMNYLLATAIAVEAAVVHNFVWHEQFTWADRLQRNTSGAKALVHKSGLIAALKRCATQNLSPWRSNPSLRRFVRFNLSNGAVSILGNLALMRVMVGQGHMNYLAANAIAIALCSLANFLVSDGWVFANDASLGS